MTLRTAIPLAAMLAVFFSTVPAEAGGIVVRNQTRKTYFCTIQGDEALHPQAQAFIFPGDAFEWHPPRGSGQAWRISVIYDDNGMSSGAPVRAHLVGNSGELCIREDEAGAKLRMADNESPKQPGETGQ